MTLAKLESRLAVVESLIHRCRDPKSLPALNTLFGRVLERVVVLDMAGKVDENELTSEDMPVYRQQVM